jgi:hypothetical protein
VGLIDRGAPRFTAVGALFASSDHLPTEIISGLSAKMVFAGTTGHVPPDRHQSFALSKRGRDRRRGERAANAAAMGAAAERGRPKPHVADPRLHYDYEDVFLVQLQGPDETAFLIGTLATRA